MLKQSSSALWDRYDLAILDLDGVVYVGPHAVPGAPDSLAKATAAGMHVAYVTNNAARPPRVVAEHLRELGIEVRDEDVVTSAQAAARLLSEHLPRGSRVFVIGGPGLFEALEEVDLLPVQSPDEDPVAVVSGYYADLRWGTVSAGAILVRQGLFWVASNTDVAVPTPAGPGPGNGVLVGAVSQFSGREPVVAGKPQATLFEETQRRVGGERPLVVGDRLDTDIEGAHNAGFDSLLVMTGVTGVDELVRAPQRLRPTYISAGLDGLGTEHPTPVERPGFGGSPAWELGGWRAGGPPDALLVEGEGGVDDWWRLVAVAGWHHLDAGNRVDVTRLSAPR
jgi:glycerol 3-phosphatase-2